VESLNQGILGNCNKICLLKRGETLKESEKGWMAGGLGNQYLIRMGGGVIVLGSWVRKLKEDIRDSSFGGEPSSWRVGRDWENGGESLAWRGLGKRRRPGLGCSSERV